MPPTAVPFPVDPPHAATTDARVPATSRDEACFKGISSTLARGDDTRRRVLALPRVLPAELARDPPACDSRDRERRAGGCPYPARHARSDSLVDERAARELADRDREIRGADDEGQRAAAHRVERTPLDEERVA